MPSRRRRPLRLRIEDAGRAAQPERALRRGGRAPTPTRRSFLSAFLDKVIEEMPVRDEEKNYDAAELARNLIDYIDADDVERGGDPEDDYYQLQNPPYRAANRPLLSIDELGLVEGFDRPLVEAIRPYVTVYPYTGGGINPNTAPSYVLAALYPRSRPGDKRLADEDDGPADPRHARRRRDLLSRRGQTSPAASSCSTSSGSTGSIPRETYTTDVFQVTRRGALRRRAAHRRGRHRPKRRRPAR